ncbi:MAG: polysaccharide deacetylase family protein [Xanthobacteraceae bacterium]|nr:polysaccharide deacetylase family protein [Xanthobacteraceae bacterium]
MALLFSDRIPYSAIADRPPLRLPDNARVVVWVIVNVEHWSADGPMPRVVIPPPMHQPLLPDLPNWAWHEYGMRVGFWRILEALRSRSITPTLALNGYVCRSYPRVTAAAHEAGWEFIGHGYKQAPMHRLEDQRSAIRETIVEIERVTGGRPRGWESPGMTETEHTLDVLSSEGIEYVADWVLDDQPVVIKAEPRPVIAMPYTVETNDVVMFTIQNHVAEEFAHRCRAQFDRLYADGAQTARIMAISVHPYLSGVPHRIGWLENVLDYIRGFADVKWWTGAQILEWYRKANA